MSFQKQIVFFLLGIIVGSSATSNKIRFYNQSEYQGFLYEGTITTACESLPIHLRDAASSIKTDQCVYLYEYDNCRNSFIRFDITVEKDLLGYFDNKVSSFKACDEIPSKIREHRIKFYAHPHPKATYYDFFLIYDTPVLPTCKNLPDPKRNVSNVEVRMCVILYSEPDCIGREFRIEYTNPRVYLTDNTVGSFQPCDPNDLKLEELINGKIIGVNFSIDFVEVLAKAKVKGYPMRMTTTYQNNGTGNISEAYSVTKEIMEYVTVQKVLNHVDLEMNRFVEMKMSKNISVSLDLLIRNAFDKAYIYEKEENLKEYLYSFQNSFKVSQKLKIPSCCEYDVKPVVNVMENYPVNFNILAEIKGIYFSGSGDSKNVKGQMTQEEIIHRLPTDNELRFVQENDDPYKIVVNVPGKMFLRYGLNVSIISDGRKMEGCLHQ